MLRKEVSNFILKRPPNFLLRKFGIGNITRRAQPAKSFHPDGGELRKPRL
jgi:hypothetical protein